MLVMVKGKLLEVIGTEYEVDGKSGISYKLVVYSDGKIEKVKVKYEYVPMFTDMVGQDIEVVTKLYIKGQYSLTHVENE